MVHVQMKQFLLLIGIAACWKANRRVTANNQTGRTLDIEQSNRTNTELQNHDNRSTVPRAYLGNRDQYLNHKTLSHDNVLTNMAQNDRNQTSTRQTLLELNTGKTLQQEPAYPSCSPVYTKTKTAADKSSHDDKEYTLTMTPAPVYKQHNQNIPDKYIHEMWMDLLKDVKYTRGNFGQISSTRVRRRAVPRPDGYKFVSRNPVTFTKCTCTTCDSGENTYVMGAYENAVYLKPATASTIRIRGNINVNPCTAVNGYRTRTPREDGTTHAIHCFRNNKDDRSPWWSVNMVYEYTVSTITLHAFQEQNFQTKLGGMDVLVDGNLCFDFFKDKGPTEAQRLLSNLGLVVNITCKEPLTGKILRFEKRSQEIRLFKSSINLCEVQVWVCKMGTYGQYPGRCRQCPTDCKYTCDNYWGCNRLVLHNAAVGRPVRTPLFQYGCQDCLADTVQATDQSKCLLGANIGRDILHWIDVRLAHNYLVYYVIVAGRLDCCSPLHLYGFNVTVVSTTSHYSYPLPEDVICAFFPGRVPTRARVNITCTQPRWGRLVGISRYGVKNLAVCELEVYAHHRFRLDTGSMCNSISETAHCNVDSICDNNICRLLPGESCSASSQCVSQGFCEQGVCKLQVNALCDVTKDNQCASGQVCDPSQRKCKINTGQQCASVTNAAVCLTGHTCETDNTCRKELGTSCVATTECVQFATCTDGECFFPVNTVCDPSQNQCGEQRTCDASLRKCRLILNYKCTRGQSNCESNAVCDRITFLCKLKRDEACSDTATCVSGAQCDDGKCVCNPEIGSIDGDECKPIAGRVGSPCGSDTDCINALCKNGVCTCRTNQSISVADFSCTSALSNCGNDRDCTTGLKCENRVCKLNIGGFCFGNEDYCLAQTTCDGTICKLGRGENCTGNENYCISRTICSRGVCKVQLGELCQGDDSCATGVCSVPDNSTCRLVAGQGCASNTEVCQSGTVCEQQTEICKLNSGKECANTSLCMLDDICVRKKGSGALRCRKRLGSTDCGTDDDCGSNAICDAHKECRLAKNANCEDIPGLCLTGGLCVNGTCQCNPDVTDPQSAECDPKQQVVVGACGPNNLCEDSVAVCKDGTCQCLDVFAIDHQKLICGIRPGFQCSSDQRHRSCITGASCIDGFCVLDAGAPCVGHNQGNCGIQSVCDTDRVCHLGLHQNCSSHPRQCRQGTVCDTLNRCKASPGDLCREAKACMAGSHCENNTCLCTEGVATLKDDVCSLNDGQVGGKCENGSCVDPLANCVKTTNLCECSPGYTPDPGWLRCVKAIGELCEEDSDCLNGSVCDPDQSKCLITLGQLCDGENRKYCSTGTVCDSDYVCKLDLRGNCSGENSVFCRLGTFCDWLGTCYDGVDDECNKTEAGSTCVAGAICNNSVCVCDPETSLPFGALCEPKAGRYGGGCEVSGSKCDVDNSVCKGGTCVCTPGSKPNHFFECVKSKKRVTGVALIAVSVILAMFILLFLTGLYVVVRKRRRGRAKAAKAVALRRGSMHALKELGLTVQEIMEEETELGSQTAATSSGFINTSSSVDASGVENTTSVTKEDTATDTTSVFFATNRQDT